MRNVKQLLVFVLQVCVALISSVYKTHGLFVERIMEELGKEQFFCLHLSWVFLNQTQK